MNDDIFELWNRRSDFKCEKSFPITRWDCETCPYFYEMEFDKYKTISCLLRQVRDWTLYHIQKNKDN